MHFQLLGIPKGDELFGKTVLIVANIVGYFIVNLQTVIVFVVTVLFNFAADVADHVLQIDMPPELILVEKVTTTEGAVGVQEGDVAEFVNVPLLLMSAQSLVRVQLLLLQNACLLLYANIAKSMQKYQT